MQRLIRCRFSAAVLLACSFALALCGCNRGPSIRPRAPVKGVVTLDGKPLPKGIVTFVPDNSKSNGGPPAIGAIDANGNYQLTTDKSGTDGALIGWHKVKIEARQDRKNEMDTLPPSLIPEKYLKESTSGLAFEVKEGENDIPIALSSKK